MKNSEVKVGERYVTKVGQRLREVIVRGRTEVRGRTRFELTQIANPGARKLSPRTAAALRPVPTARKATEPAPRSTMTHDSLAAEGFVYVPDLERWLHPDGREADLRESGQGHDDALGPTPCDGCGDATVAIVCASPEGLIFCAACRARMKPMPDFALLNDVALEQLHTHGRELAVREAAGAELKRRATVIATAVEHDLLVRTETVEAIALRFLRIETLEERKSDRLDFKECSVWSVKAALEAAYQAGAAAALVRR